MSIEEHVLKKGNPHEITKAQLGLSNIKEFKIADRNDVLGLSRDDCYIDLEDTELVTDAFAYHLYRIGLVTHPDVIKSPPPDEMGKIIFILDLERNFLVKGWHPEADSVVFRLQEDGSDIHDEDINISFKYWDKNLNALNLSVSGRYSVIADYRNEYLYPESRHELPMLTLEENMLEFSISEDNGLFYVRGNHIGPETVNVYIEDLDSGVQVYKEENIAIQRGIDWYISLEGQTLDYNGNYKVTVEGYIYDFKVFESIVTELSPFVLLGTQYVKDEEQEYYDFRSYQNTTEDGLYYQDLASGE